MLDSVVTEVEFSASKKPVKHLSADRSNRITSEPDKSAVKPFITETIIERAVLNFSDCVVAQLKVRESEALVQDACVKRVYLEVRQRQF